jgi:hypothetical protein
MKLRKYSKVFAIIALFLILAMVIGSVSSAFIQMP